LIRPIHHQNVRRAWSLAVPAAAALAAVAWAAPPPAPSTPSDPALAEAIRRFDTAQSEIQRISAHFEEVKTIGLLKDPVKQSGQFYHTKPDKFLWEYTAPEPKLLMLNGKDILAYYPSQKRAEEIHTRFSKRIVKYMGLGSVLKDLADEYDMALSRENEIADTDLLILKPKSRTVSKRLSEIRIWIDHELNQPKQLEYIEADGDKTLIRFNSILINPEISLTKYELKLPDGVTVTNGLSGFFGGSSR
jgi:outer membrane lipoprotein carrier protein